MVSSMSSECASSSLTSARKVSQAWRRRSVRRSRSFSRASPSRSAVSSASGRAYGLGVAETRRVSPPCQGHDTGRDTVTSPGPAASGEPYSAIGCDPRPSAWSSRTTPPVAPVAPHSLASSRPDSGPIAAGSDTGSSLWASAASAAALGAPNGGTAPLGAVLGRFPRVNRNHTPFPAPCCMVPQLVAKWSTSSMPRPPSASSTPFGVVRVGRLSAKSVTVTVSSSRSATTSRSISVAAWITPLVASSVVSSSASSITSVSSTSVNAARTSSRAAPGVRRSAGRRTRRTTVADTKAVSTEARYEANRSARAARPARVMIDQVRTPGRPRSDMTTVERAPDRTADGAVLAELAEALLRVRQGDFKVRLPRRTGLAGEVVDRFNDVAELQERRNRELRRISRVVGREGRMTERVDEEMFEGDWATGVRAVNGLIDDLGRPTTEIARVIVAVAEGDLSQKMANEIDGRPLRGEFLRIGRAVNTMVDQLSSFAAEVTRVAREVGTEGKLGGQADVRGVSGTWRDLTDSVNHMASNLTNQVRSIAEVSTAVARGDLSRKITVSAKGEVAELADTINSLTDTLRLFAEEVTRVAREVGTEGKLGGQAEVPGVAGTWKDLTESVNSMASNLTNQVRNIAQVATAVANGDLSQKITVAALGEILELKDTVNTMVDQLSSFADEVTRVAREVGTEGKLGGQAQVREVAGTWRDLTENVNQLASNLTSQVRNIAQVTTAVAKGDLSQKITVDAQGEILELKNTVNTMVDQLSSFADEVTRVAREVGTEGKLGGQAQVRGVAGTWRDLTDNVNFMASNLTAQVRNIAQVTTAVAKGDLSQKITVDAQGEILELKNTVNTMVDQLSSFAVELTRVGREVGIEGKLGGLAQVRGVSGTWRDLTENVNQLASTLTTQLRAIAQVSTAVTRGDLTQRIAVEAQGEIAELKDNINQMIVTLRETTKKNAEQGWLDSNLARIGGLLQGQRDLGEVCRMIMNEVTPLVNAQLGAFFLAGIRDGALRLRLT